MEPAPPEDLRPGQAGTLLDGVANPRDVTATIVDLAVRGYLRIEETGETEDTGETQDTREIEDTGEEEASRDWRLARLGKTGGLLDYEQILLDGLFLNAATDSDVPSVRLSELGSEFAAEFQRERPGHVRRIGLGRQRLQRQRRLLRRRLLRRRRRRIMVTGPHR